MSAQRPVGGVTPAERQTARATARQVDGSGGFTHTTNKKVLLDRVCRGEWVFWFVGLVLIF